MKDLERILAQADASIREAIEAVDRGEAGIALLVDEGRHLRGTITDGDIRRAILERIDLDAPLTSLLNYHPGGRWNPTTAQVGTDRNELLRLMRTGTIRRIPFLPNTITSRSPEVILPSLPL